MTDGSELLDRVRHAFEKVPDTVEQRMFGSLGFLTGGVLRVGVGSKPDHVMMARVPLERMDGLLAEDGVDPAVMRGRPMRGWVFLQPEAVRTVEQVERWVTLSLERSEPLAPARRSRSRNGASAG